MLIAHTVANSQYDSHRGYLGMSQIIADEAEILKKFRSETPATQEHQLKCYKGYQMEADLVKRCKQIWGDKITTGKELSAYNGMVKGNPDFFLNNKPCDCKSVLLDSHIPEPNKLPKRVYWQMQAYMLYAKENLSFVIYESRESGKLSVIAVRQNRHIQAEIELKFQRLVKAIR